MTSGYSETPLAKKLNLRDGQRCWFDNMPESIWDEIGEYALELTFVADPAEGIDAGHIFVSDQAELESKLTNLREHVSKDGQLWVSWPKMASGVASEIDQAAVQAAGLAIGLVDTKKCAVDETWSGLKFVIRKELR